MALIKTKSEKMFWPSLNCLASSLYSFVYVLLCSEFSLVNEVPLISNTAFVTVGRFPNFNVPPFFEPP